MDIINIETITGTVTADSLRDGANKINNNFTRASQALVDIQNILCNSNNDICNLYPKLSIVADIGEFQYTPVENGDTLFHTGSGYNLALAELSDSQEAVGVIHHVDTANDKVYITLDGYLCNQQGLSAGTQYYLSNLDPGKLVPLEDVTTCDILKPIYIAISSTEAIVNIMKSSLIGISDFTIYNIPWEEFTSYNEIQLEAVMDQSYPWISMKDVISYDEILTEIAITAPGLPVRMYRAYSFNETTLEISASGSTPQALLEARDMTNYSEFSAESVTTSIPHSITEARPLTNYAQITAELLCESTPPSLQSLPQYNFSNISSELVTIA